MRLGGTKAEDALYVVPRLIQRAFYGVLQGARSNSGATTRSGAQSTFRTAPTSSLATLGGPQWSHVLP